MVRLSRPVRVWVRDAAFVVVLMSMGSWRTTGYCKEWGSWGRQDTVRNGDHGGRRDTVRNGDHGDDGIL